LVAAKSSALPRVGVLILNWNKPHDTIACLRSLQNTSYQNLDVVVIDNGSDDDSIQILRSAFPKLNLIENGSNLGFAAGNNVGIRLLIERNVDYVMLLNDDTEIQDDLFERLVEIGESDEAIAVLGPTIYYYSMGDVIWSAGGSVDRYGEPSHPRSDEKDDGRVSGPQNVDYVTGCAFLMKRSALDRIGPLDESFFIYFEETEWCARARRYGFRVVYVPEAKMWHKVTPTARVYSRRYLYLMSRNRLLYLRATGASWPIFLMATSRMLRSIGAWALYPKHAHMRPFVSASLLGMRDYFLHRFGPPPSVI